MHRTLAVIAFSVLASSCRQSNVEPPFAISHRYETRFSGSEWPIFEKGAWHHTRNAFTLVRTQQGIAHGTNGAADTYDDSYALLSGFGPDQSASAIVYRSAALLKSVNHEVELLLRAKDDANGVRAYECLFAHFGSVQIVRWNGPLGDFTDLRSAIGPGKFGRELRSGDVVQATIVGNVISAYINGQLMLRTTDDQLKEGQPGISFFTRPGGNSADFGLTSYSAESN